MAGISDLPFRSLALRFGASRVVSEMVASGEILHGRPEARARAELGCEDSRTAVQLAGRDPDCMAEAARFVAGEGAQVIDINFGCPAKKVTGGLSGSALMRDPDHALRLIEAVVGAVSVPVTLKLRLGWDHDSLNAPQIAARAEAAGVRMITVHGRTRCQFYRGPVDWTAISRVCAAVRIPVIANGDITSVASAREALRQSGAAGLMIGRGAQGRPWLVGQVAAALSGQPEPPAPRGRALCELIIGHYEAMLDFYGRDVGLRVARKHLGWYLAYLPDVQYLRRRILVANDPAAVMRDISAVLGAERAGDRIAA